MALQPSHGLMLRGKTKSAPAWDSRCVKVGTSPGSPQNWSHNRSPVSPLASLFARVQIPDAIASEIGPLAQKGSVIYVMRSSGWLNATFMRWLATRLGLPAVRAVVGLVGFFRWLAGRRGTMAALGEAASQRASGLIFLRRPRMLRARGVTTADPFPSLVELQRRLGHPV